MRLFHRRMFPVFHLLLSFPASAPPKQRFETTRAAMLCCSPLSALISLMWLSPSHRTSTARRACSKSKARRVSFRPLSSSIAKKPIRAVYITRPREGHQYQGLTLCNVLVHQGFLSSNCLEDHWERRTHARTFPMSILN